MNILTQRGTVHEFRGSREAVSPEVDGCAEDALEGSDKSSVLFPARLHPEAFKHLGSGAKPNRPALLLDGKRCEKDRNQAILAERKHGTRDGR